MSDPTLAQTVRLAIYAHFLEHAQPPLVEELMATFELSRPQTIDVIRELADNRSVAVVKGTSRILMAWPFSAIATPFRVWTRGRSYYANCSWDAIAFHAMLAQDDVDIDSFCHHCGARIRIEMRAGKAARVDPPETIVYLALRPTEWWEDIITTCSNTMVFFCSREHRDASDIRSVHGEGASLTPDQAHQLGIPLYARRLEIDYARPGRDDLNSHFAALGMTTDYWRI